jgi:hypothetical protein
MRCAPTLIKKPLAGRNVPNTKQDGFEYESDWWVLVAAADVFW